MIRVWLFWLALAVPGLAVLCWTGPRKQPQGLLQQLAIGYLITFALLSPISAAGYWLQLPLAVLSSSVIILELAGLYALWLKRDRWWPLARPDFMTVAAWAVLALLLYQGAAIGAHMNNDADFHLARIRFLREHGLSNHDPFVWVGFTHVYHTNILHALLAAASQITRLDVLEVWFDSAAWARLVTAGGIFTLGRCLSGQLAGGWLAAFLYLGWHINLGWLLYPNMLSPGWLLPIGLASFIGATTSEERGPHIITLAMTTLVLAQVHGLYAGFQAAMIGSGLVLVTAVGLLRKGHRLEALRNAVAISFAIVTCVPSLYISVATHAPIEANFDYAEGPPKPAPRRVDKWVKSLTRNEAGQLYLPDRRLFATREARPFILAALLLLFWRRRAPMAVCAAALLGPLLVLTQPPLATWVASKLGAPWMLDRLVAVLLPTWSAVLGAGATWPLERFRAFRWATPLWALGAVVLASYVHGGPADVRHIWDKNRAFIPVSLGNHHVRRLESDRRMIAAFIPPGSTVFAHPVAARELAKLYDMRFIRAWRNHTGVDDLKQRTIDMAMLLNMASLEGAWPLLQRYGIRYGIWDARNHTRWMRGAKILAQTSQLRVLDLKPTSPSNVPQPAPPPLRSPAPVAADGAKYPVDLAE